MSLYQLREGLSFNLSENYKFNKGEEFENKESIFIYQKKNMDEQDEEKYKCRYDINFINLNLDEKNNLDKPLVDYLNSNLGDYKYIKISSQPNIIMASLEYPYYITNYFTKKIKILSAFIQLDDDKVLNISGEIIFNTKEIDFDLEHYQDFYDLLKSIEYKGNKVKINKSVDMIKKSLSIPKDERYEAWMFSYGEYLNEKQNFQFTNKTYTIISTDFSEKELEEKLKDKGAELNNLLNENTDYLIVNPFITTPKIIKKALDIKEDSKDLRIVLLESLETELGIRNTYRNWLDLEANKRATTNKANEQSKDQFTKQAKEIDGLQDFEKNLSSFSNIVEDAEKKGLLSSKLDIIEKTKKELNKFQEDLDIAIKAKELNEKYEAERKAKEEEKRKAKEQELERKKLKVLTKKDIENYKVDMFVTLTNEEIVDKLDRIDDEFIKKYKDDFYALSDEEIITFKSEMLIDIKNNETSNYFNSFKARSTDHKFKLSTHNLFNIAEGFDFDELSQFAINNTKKYYNPSEYSNVESLMKKEVKNLRLDVDEQFLNYEEGWINYQTAKTYLEFNVQKLNKEESQKDENSDNFQVISHPYIITVQLAKKVGIARMFTNVLNYTPWYWGVKVIDIWEDTYKNYLSDLEDKDSSEKALVESSMNKIREIHSNKKEKNSNKEGCYIATAIYGNYNAPEVIVLRDYRDNILGKSKLGRTFIKIYYKSSPSLVKYFENKNVVSNFVRSVLNKIIENLTKTN